MFSAYNLLRKTFLAKSRRPVARRRFRLLLEELETRNLMSVTAAGLIAQPNFAAMPAVAPLTAPSGVAGGPYTPAQIQAAYGFNTLPENGSGQTIAIVDAFNDPNLVSDLQVFNSSFNLPQFNATGGPAFTRLNESGAVITGTTNAPQANGNWALETSLDVEWAHAIAPQANIVLVEASSQNFPDLMKAVATAASQASVVSMSWGVNEFAGETGAAYDGQFASLIAKYPGVTFVASAGDSGSLQGPEWPSVSPYVLAVGGTSLTATAGGGYVSESGWGNSYRGSYAVGSYYFGGGGGGISQYEAQPSYQSGVVTQSTSKRTTPDVSYDANPNTGVYVYDSYQTRGSPWQQVGGTSVGAPQWAGLLALVNQGRGANGSLGQAQYALYSTYQTDAAAFHDVTTGNNGFAAGTGYDLVTGLGTPVAGALVPALINYSGLASPAVAGPAGTSGSGTQVGLAAPHAQTILVNVPAGALLGDMGSTAAGGALSSINPTFAAGTLTTLFSRETLTFTTAFRVSTAALPGTADPITPIPMTPPQGRSAIGANSHGSGTPGPEDFGQADDSVPDDVPAPAEGAVASPADAALREVNLGDVAAVGAVSPWFGDPADTAAMPSLVEGPEQILESSGLGALALPELPERALLALCGLGLVAGIREDPRRLERLD